MRQLCQHQHYLSWDFRYKNETLYYLSTYRHYITNKSRSRIYFGLFFIYMSNEIKINTKRRNNMINPMKMTIIYILWFVSLIKTICKHEFLFYGTCDCLPYEIIIYQVDCWNALRQIRFVSFIFVFFFFILFAGPVQFPSPPTDGPVESSGVIVGASGYGFVPPSNQQSKP